MTRYALLPLVLACPTLCQDPTVVKVVSAGDGPWPAAIRVTGHIEARDIVHLRAAIDGQVDEVHADVGASLEAGDLVLRLSTPGTEADLAVAEANLAHTQSLVEIAARRRESAAIALEHAAHQLKQIKLEEREIKELLDIAIADSARTEVMVEAGTVSKAALTQSQQKLIEVRRQAREFTGQIRAAELDEMTARALIAEREAQVAERRELLGVAHAQLQRERSRSGQARVTCPLPEAVVLKRLISRGDMVRALQTELFELADLSSVRVRIMIPRVEIPHVQFGTKVWIRRDAYSVAYEESAITNLGYAVQKDAEGKIWRPAEIVFQNQDRRWLIGDECSMWLFPKTGTASAQVIPTSAVIEDDGKAFIFHARRSRGGDLAKIGLARVILGRRDGDHIEILTGLGRSLIVVDPPPGLENDAIVKLQDG